MAPMQCPGRLVLEDFVAGRPTALRWETIAEHVESCDRCQAVIEGAESPADRLLSQSARSGAGRSPFQEEPQCRVAVRKFEWTVAHGLRHKPADADTVSARDSHSQTLPGDEPQVPREASLDRLGHYRLFDPLGSGGMGRVFRAIHTRLNRPVAVKLLTADRLDSPQAVRRFWREMEMVGALDHPNLVRATDAGEDGGVHYLVMELIEGLDLARLLKRLGPLPIADASELIRQAAVGLQHIHDHGFVHRDIKPSNLMLATDGRVKILDLGLALLASCGDGSLTASSSVMGTLDYMAPEQAGDSHRITFKADLYSLGCSFYHLLGGSPPFPRAKHQTPLSQIMAHAQAPAPSLQDHRPEVPDGVASLLGRMLAKRPEDRPDSAAEIAEALGPFTTGADPAVLLERACPSKQTAAIPREQKAEVADRAPAAKHGGDDNLLSTTTLPASHGSGRRIRYRSTLAAVFGGALILALAAIVIVRDRHGNEIARLPVPRGGSAVVVAADEDVPAEPLPQDATDRQSSPKKEPPATPRQSVPADAILTGLVPKPAPLPRGERWQVDTVAPRGQTGGIASSPDGRFLSVGSHDGQLRIYRADTGELVRLFGSDAHTVAWSPDSTQLVAVPGYRGPPEKFPFWSMQEGKRGPTLERTWLLSLAAAWHPSQDLLAVPIGPWDHVALELRSIPEFATVATLPGLKGHVYTIDWSPDGRRLAAVSSDGKLRVWDFDGKRGQLVLQVDIVGVIPHATDRIAWSPDSRQIATLHTPRAVQIWEVETGEAGPVLEGERECLLSLDWSPDGKWIAAAGLDGVVHVWEALAGRRDRSFKHAWYVTAVAWTGDGRYLVSAARNGSLRAWEFATGEPAWAVGEVRSGPLSAWTCLAWGPDGRRIAAGAVDGKVRIFESGGGALHDEIATADKPVRAVVWSPDAARIGISDDQRTVVCDAETGRELRALEGPPGNALAWHPADDHIAVGPFSGLIHVANSQTGEVAETHSGHSGVVLDIAWSPNGRRFASGSWDRTLRVWSDQGEVKILGKHEERVAGVAWSPDGRYVAGVSFDSHLRAWDVAQDAPKLHFEVKLPRQLSALAWSPDGRRLLSADINGIVRVHDSQDATVLAEFSDHTSECIRVVWSPDGSKIASISNDATLRVRDARSGEVQWLALFLPGGETAVFTAAGELVHPVEQVPEGLVYVVEEADQVLQLLSPADFFQKYPVPSASSLPCGGSSP